MKKAVLQLHGVVSPWSSCIKLHIQHLFLGICADAGLIIYGGDNMEAYAHSSALNNTYLWVDVVYAEWYGDKYKTKLSKRMVLSVKYTLQGHPESGKMWMKMIDNILITELGFRTTTHNRCVYIYIYLKEMERFNCYWDKLTILC